MMNKESLGSLVVKDGKVYEVIGYIDDPCLELVEKATGLRETVVIGSRESMKYKDIKEYIKELNWSIEEYVEKGKEQGD